MQNELKRFTDRFKTLFDNEGLINVKFFVKDQDNLRLSDFLEEVTKIQDTIAAGGCSIVTSVDSGFDQRRFDAPF